MRGEEVGQCGRLSRNIFRFSYPRLNYGMGAFLLQVDQKNEAVLLPVYGLLVPFHIATVKSVSSQQDGGHSYIRIIFNVPGAGFGPNDVPTQKFPRSIYVKEVSFRSNDTRHSYQVVQLIKTLRRQVAQRESERAERATLVTQERLQIGKGRPIRYFGHGTLVNVIISLS